MDPLTIALATFGVQKIRGKSTRTALKDAATMAGLGQFAGMAGFGPFKAFGSTSLPGMTGQFLGANPAAGTVGPVTAPTFGEQFASTSAGGGIDKLIGNKAMTADQIKAAKLKGAAAEKAAKGSGFMGLGTGEKLFLGTTALSLLPEDEVPFEPPFTEEDYKQAKEREAAKLKGGFEPASPYTGGITSFAPASVYAAKGGLAEIKKFNEGGINYLPSKSTHDENDVHNYVRAQGYVEDGAGNGDRKEMRSKGANFFYDQQKKFKRIFDLVDAKRERAN